MSSLEDGLNASPGYLLARLGAESRRRWVDALSSEDVRPQHFYVLMTLGAVGETSQRRMGEEIGIDPRNLVGVIDVLEQRGLLERVADRADRRRHTLRLTDSGRKALRRLARSGQKAEDELLAPLSNTEQAQLQRLLLKLLPALKAE